MRGLSQVLRMMMTIDAIKHFEGHAEKTSGLPFVDASLREPGCCSVTQSVRRNLIIEPRESDGTRECCLDRLHGLTIPLDHELSDNALCLPAP